MKKIILLSILILFTALSCNLEETPKSTIGEGPVFNTEEGLEMYSNSFYNYLPGDTRLFTSSMSYYIAGTSVNNFLVPGAYNSNNSSGWSWTQLRNINYFIDHNNSEEVPEEVRKNYEGLARFFRAYFYFTKMKRFGDVPWIDRPLDVDDPELTATQDDRTFIADKILEDLDYAIANISNERDESASTITSTVAAAFKSRVALWEGSFRKYHTSYGLESSANDYFQQAVDAAQVVMDAGYSIYKGLGPEKSYRELFVTKNPISSEVLYATTFDKGLGTIHSGNHCWVSVTYCGMSGMTRSFVKTYLMKDGTSFMDQPGAEEMSFVDEMQDRDARLSQTIITPGFKRMDGTNEKLITVDFAKALTGYSPIKYTTDDMSLDNVNENENNAPIFRYAEVLLNYAEAKAEMGDLTDGDWAATIGELRDRAGITGGLDQKPTQVDTYLQQRFFPDITDPVLLEIRRERGIELAYEGFSWEDTQRWAEGDLLEDVYDGIYIDQLDTPFDLDGDGDPDVAFTMDDSLDGVVDNNGVYHKYVGATLDNGATNNYQLAADGHTLLYASHQTRKFEDRNYFYPVPHADMVMNPNLKQTPGWED